MNLLLLEQQDFIADNKARISDTRFEHIQKILKSKLGDTLTAGILNGNTGTATITALSADAIEIETQLTQTPPTPLPLVMILALPRPPMLRRILSNIAEFGIKELHLIHSNKVEKSFWQSPALNEMDHYLKLGLAQAKDTLLPNIHCHTRFKPFIEDQLPILMENKETFIAHPYHAQVMPDASNQSRVVIIGPEGGFTDYEVELICSKGASAISMGDRIYRVENAVTLLCSHLSKI